MGNFFCSNNDVVTMNSELRSSIEQAYWDKRDEFPRIPMQSYPVENSDYHHQLKASLLKSDPGYENKETRLDRLALDGVVKEYQEMFVKLVWSMGDFDKKSADIVENDGGSYHVFISHSDIDPELMMGMMEAIEKPNVVDLSIASDAYDEPLIIFEDFKYEINLSDFQEESDRISYHIDYRVTWSDAYEVSEINI